MATLTELQSLNQIEYKSKVKIYFYILIAGFLFSTAFLNFYPIGDKFKSVLKSTLKGTACNPDFDQIRVEWLMPKIVVTDLNLPASCLGRTGEALKFNHLTVNFNFINFAPFGIPFKIETEMSGQPLTVYFVQGINNQMIRLKDQNISLARIQPLLGEFKIGGNIVVDLNLHMINKNIQDLAFKAQSKDFQIPPQSIQGFTTPTLKLNELYLEANSSNGSKITIDKLILGDTDSPMRANFKGRISLQEGAVAMSPLDMAGEVAFNENLKQTLPLIDILFQSFAQRDGFYQVRLGGTLGAPKPLSP